MKSNIINIIISICVCAFVFSADAKKPAENSAGYKIMMLEKSMTDVEKKSSIGN